jgi:hypothetical protein
VSLWRNMVRNTPFERAATAGGNSAPEDASAEVSDASRAETVTEVASTPRASYAL